MLLLTDGYTHDHVVAAWSFSVPDLDADVLHAMACRDDDGGKITVTTITDRLSARVWELSQH